MDVLQEALNKATAELPVLFLQNLISKKLHEQRITPPKGLSQRMAEYFLAGNRGPFRYNGRNLPKNVTLTFTKADAEQIEQAIDRFCATQLPKIISRVARGTAISVLKDLKSRWSNEYTRQEQDLSGFRERLEGRWSKPLGQLRMLLTMVREWSQEAHQRDTSRKMQKEQSRGLLIRLLVRACQVTDEIICLLENGFADGAMARWRTLHEIAVVAAIISQYGESIAERYVAHQAVESKKAMDKHLACYKQLGYKPLPVRAQKKILMNYDKVSVLYGNPFKSDYGWAAAHLKKDRPTFADLEAAAGRSHMRSHYQMGNDNVHAGIKSMFIRLGLLEVYTALLAGRSNAGLTEPGQNAALTLTQLAVLVCMKEPNFDDLVVGQMMVTLQDEIHDHSTTRANAFAGMIKSFCERVLSREPFRVSADVDHRHGGAALQRTMSSRQEGGCRLRQRADDMERLESQPNIPRAPTQPMARRSSGPPLVRASRRGLPRPGFHLSHTGLPR